MADLSDKHFQQVLRDIVLPPEARTGGVIPQGKSVPAGQGEHWFDGGKDGKDPPDDKKPPPDGGEPPDDEKPPMDPRKPPSEGDPGNGIGPFYPCDGEGNCVNVRFDGNVPVPEGWTDACTPPEEKPADSPENPSGTAADEYGEIDKNVYYRYELWWGEDKTEGTVRRPQYVGEKIKAKFSQDLRASYGTYGYDQSGRWALQEVYDKVMNGEWGRWGGDYARYPPYTHSKTWGVYISVHYCSTEPDKICEDKPEPQWPLDKCAEIIATEDGFKAACDNIDMRLPPNLQGEFTAFELCDGDGNKVTVRKDDLRGGWIVDHPQYTARINTSFQVQSVEHKI